MTALQSHAPRDAAADERHRAPRGAAAGERHHAPHSNVTMPWSSVAITQPMRDFRPLKTLFDILSNHSSLDNINTVGKFQEYLVNYVQSEMFAHNKLRTPKLQDGDSTKHTDLHFSQTPPEINRHSFFDLYMKKYMISYEVCAHTGVPKYQTEQLVKLVASEWGKLLFDNPVTAADGQTYEKDEIEKYWSKGVFRSPLTNSFLPDHSLRPAITVRQTIEKLLSAEIESGKAVALATSDLDHNVPKALAIEKLLLQIKPQDVHIPGNTFLLKLHGLCENEHLRDFAAACGALNVAGAWCSRTQSPAEPRSNALSCAHACILTRESGKTRLSLTRSNDRTALHRLRNPDPGLPCPHSACRRPSYS